MSPRIYRSTQRRAQAKLCGRSSTLGDADSSVACADERHVGCRQAHAIYKEAEGLSRKTPENIVAGMTFHPRPDLPNPQSNPS
eukprot:1941494-Rhodomonas_salina.2